MPEKSGIDTIQELRQQDPALKIIAISGGPGSDAQTRFTVFQQMLDAALQVGANQTLTKPFPNKTLLDAIDSHLNH